jgi:hypothetical protein
MIPARDVGGKVRSTQYDVQLRVVFRVSLAFDADLNPEP